MFATTVIQLSTAPTALISTATTWANTFGASNFDTVPFALHNPSTAQRILWGGAAVSTDGSGFPLGPGLTQSFDLLKSDAIFGMTTASTVTVNVVSGRQVGGRGD